MTPVRACSVLLVLLLGTGLLLLCRRLSTRSSRPAAVWAAGGYLLLLHLLAVVTLLSSVAFENGLPTLALLTFPFSMTMFNTIRMQGFVAPADLAANYVRYIVCFGGLNAALLAGFLALVTPPRRVPLRGPNPHRRR